jgi:hypothetical protein
MPQQPGLFLASIRRQSMIQSPATSSVTLVIQEYRSSAPGDLQFRLAHEACDAWLSRR